MPRRPAVETEATPSFYSNDILTALGLSPNETYIAVADLCARLGLNRAAQEKRVRSNGLLASHARTMLVDTDEGELRALCLPIEALPFWLATLDASSVREELRPKLDLFQRECASLLWQSFRPQGYGAGDALLPPRHEQNAAEQAYVSATGMATLARHQMLIERQLANAQARREGQGADPWDTGPAIDDPSAARLAQTVRRVATTLSERTRRNEYGGIYSGLYRQFGIASYRRMPVGRLTEALEWLERWHGDMLGIPEPPPDI
ncbi:MAG: hypothetical protein MUD01_24160 [Chloroflexaceae bacterium]|jgi:hypothetical protein|nr:hypothetical protein [Chloroflexaceae bacterium]